MGCCLSTTTPTTTKPKSHKPNPDSPMPNPYAGAPPPPPPQPVEEETVKEVLSETPFPKPPTPKLSTAYKNHLGPVVPEQPKIQPTAAIRPINSRYDNHHHQPPNHLHPVAEQPRIHQPTAAIKPNGSSSYHQPPDHLHPVAEQPRIQPTPAVKPPDEIVSEVSDLSELYSFSESLSTVTENFIENEGEVTQRVRHRSPVKNARRKRPAVAGGGRTPARRSEPSPAKKGQVSQGRNVTPARRNAGPSNVLRRDAGEGSGRRSRSPATRGEGGVRRPVRSAGGQDRRSRTPAGRRDGGEGGAAVPETAAEKSLDDANVSLECFIFL